MKKIAIMQSNYIPWRGYFDLIAAVDEFVFYDDMQFTKNDWRNRNKIRTQTGTAWLSIPVGPDIHRRIRDVPLPTGSWRQQHWHSLQSHYRSAPFFKQISELLHPFYHGSEHHSLSGFNRSLLEAICGYLKIGTLFRNSWDYDLSTPHDLDARTSRLLHICRQAGASEYVSSPMARDYLDVAQFRDISLRWFDYDNYPAYPQQKMPFEPFVSIVDLLFNCGHDSPHYMKYVHP